MGARRRPIVSGVERSGFLLMCWLRGFYLLFACSLWGSLPRRKAAAGGCSSAKRAGERAARTAAAPYPMLDRAKRPADQEMAVAPY